MSILEGLCVLVLFLCVTMILYLQVNSASDNDSDSCQCGGCICGNTIKEQNNEKN